ncbi:DUF5661 family protein [Haloimpatiens sp. FM7330]|uniref:DUF5661 family protein n=1 Tax=Haloimpatiens sp. FM7330 TaxID=3298610 RepID=UPI0036455ADC
MYSEPYIRYPLTSNNSLEKSLELINNSISNKKNDELFYNRLIHTTPTAKDSTIMPKTSFTTEESMEIAKQLGIDFTKEKFDLEQFKIGLDTELEHGRKYFPTNVTEDNPVITGKIALAHLREFPDYYTRLTKLEEEANAYWNVMNTKDYTPDQWVMYIEPLVKRALAEYNEGINLEHLFQEFILSGVLVGLGKKPQEAIEQVEQWEKTGQSQLLKQSKMKNN